MRETNIVEKFLASVINVAVVGIVFFPFIFSDVSSLIKKLILIVIFLLYNLLVLIFNKNRCIGMVCLRTRWKENYPFVNQAIYILLYTLSFSTLLFHVYFLFDLFLLNMIFLQLPMVVLKKNTLHGYLSGKMITVKTSP
ncbi:hypothetical protein A3I34_02570 [Candidatus Jorgensenbacteria bacterium RIFCSPLOWO2_02_FULL_45_12]|uniref:RDD domain-containing protein n=2 Tax=Candidatus Joergenseniibacteriota TaxID=1752739 RepID=A0A1F6BQT6_9BACT|nr:MAG: hypothetical protein UX22_C0007G0033 [Candidatus Jorgensenbacteria bacterium GW2011_GWA2_45_9]OGG39286.1 MAG: hypothetical protein A3D55_02705 [Candidatus Jorgensenbacteria bacterium RIFCSPHIGHO2_02_FULL_45_20]OGG42765.1 MAG: hypothetical protein A3I34_02570 [Candidatus Jorgensenbacteria bacterium RIFCSPLOWO2_02_FULL_45_12]